ncbi:MAG: Holliday junction resolvase RuvX [Balneolaceae bacterium]|nr:MAG: Holliday junction resolvase RuvX [Balneolaceae bacterium]
MVIKGRILSLDVGIKRVGIARSDVLQTIATPVGAFETNKVFQYLKNLFLSEPFEKIVVGWPVNLKGETGHATEMVEKFIKKLKKELPGVEIVTLDERFTSHLAQQSIAASGVSRKRRQEKGLVDAVAAAILLQDYLDRN